MTSTFAARRASSFSATLARGLCIGVAVLMLPACEREPAQPTPAAPSEAQPPSRQPPAQPAPQQPGAPAPAHPEPAKAQSITLYSSVDDPLLRQLVAEFHKRHPEIKVNVVGDTEATKTTGLVQRLLSEKGSPRADVWWSNERLGTRLLADQGLFEPVDSPADLPAEYQDEQRAFHAFALRSRVIAYATKRITDDTVPRRLAELVKPEWKNRVGMARPQFGTTRAHITSLLAGSGEQALRTWLAAMKANGLRLYDGNSSVVKAIAHGEIDIGLTDTDDVFSGQRENWPVACIYEMVDPARAEGDSDPSMLISTGPLFIPNTIALLKGAPHAEPAKVFIAFVLSEDVERLLAESDSHNTPLRPALRASLGPAFDRYAVPAPQSPPPSLVATSGSNAADLVSRAMKICDEELGS